jgi:hypothetical protein
MYGFLSGVFSILFLIQIVFSIIIVSQKRTALEEVATYYSVVCFVLFLISRCISCSVLDGIEERYHVPRRYSLTTFSCYSCTSLLMCIFWGICNIYMAFVASSLQTVVYPLQSIFMFGVEFPDLIFSLRIMYEAGWGKRKTQ